MKSQVLHTVWCDITDEPAGEVWTSSLSGVKGHPLPSSKRVGIGSDYTIIFHLIISYESQVRHTVWCNISVMRLQGKFEIDHSWEQETLATGYSWNRDCKYTLVFDEPLPGGAVSACRLQQRMSMQKAFNVYAIPLNWHHLDNRHSVQPYLCLSDAPPLVRENSGQDLLTRWGVFLEVRRRRENQYLIPRTNLARCQTFSH